ncbi:EIN3-binding F-box protein 1-like [Camellia sinensis]|uniref:EIN3-binding F-box protein 1-like n=1 Tax=Camellia sinensis TaxID=4442 RepID=UPI00103566E8|nr:EIN3-binding F-box protein 1-like [Camellia sinensis]
MKHLYKELSEDCWELILNQLAIDDFNHLQSPSLVCKLFLSITDRLRLKLNVPNRLFYSHNCEGLFRALQRFTNLQEIELRDPIFGDKADVNYPIQRITSSEKILIYDDSGLSFHGLSNFLCGCPSLTHLTLCFNNFLTDNYMRDLCRYLPNLVSIKFNRCSNITTATFFILAKECPMLSKIGLPNIKPQVEDDFNLELKRNYRIRSLDLTCSVYLNDEFIKKVGAVCPNLQTLNLNGLLSLIIEGIGEILRCCSQIKHLIVDRTRDMVIFLKQFKTRRIKNGHGYNLEGLYD